MRVHDQLLVADEVERAVGVGLAVRRRDVHLAQVVRQPAQHGQADRRDVAAVGGHQRAIEGHRGDGVVVGLRTRGLGGGEQELHHRMERQVGGLAREACAVPRSTGASGVSPCSSSLSESSSVIEVTPSCATRQLSSGWRSWRSSSLRCSAAETGWLLAHSLMPEMSKMSVAAMIRLVSLASRMAASACGLALRNGAWQDRVDMAADPGISFLLLLAVAAAA